jgi:hypothetical protein
MADELADDIAAAAVGNAAQFLKGIRFPARRADLERVARGNGADESALDEIRRLPDREFRDPAQLFAALGDETQGL